MSDDKLDQAIYQTIAIREKRKAAEAKVKELQKGLLDFMLQNKAFVMHPDGKLRYETPDHALSLKSGYEMRRFFDTAEPELLEALKEASSRPAGHSAHEVLLMASQFSRSKIEVMERHGKLDKEQLRALFDLEPTLEWRVHVSSTGATGVDGVNELLDEGEE